MTCDHDWLTHRTLDERIDEEICGKCGEVRRPVDEELAARRTKPFEKSVVIFDTTPGQAESLVEQFRARHPKIVAFWKGLRS